MTELGGLNPKYWYVEDGVIKKFIYCKMCHAGPFKESEKKENFDFYGMGNRDPYCKICASLHKNFQSSVSPKSHNKPEETKWDREKNSQSHKTKSPFDPTEEPKESGTPELD
jgi:hypothetical protein